MAKLKHRFVFSNVKIKLVTTSQRTNFKGYLDLKEILNEEKNQNFVPIFRGNYIRKSL